MNRILPKTGKVKMRRLLHKYHVSLKGYWDRDRKNSKLGLRSYGTPEPLSQVSRLRAHPSIGSIFCLLWFWNLELTQGSIEFLWNWLEVVLVFVYDCRSQRSGDYSNAYGFVINSSRGVHCSLKCPLFEKKLHFLSGLDDLAWHVLEFASLVPSY